MRVMTQARSHLHSDSVSGSGLIRSRESGNRSGSRSDSAPVVRPRRAGFARRFRPGMAALFFALPLLGGCPAAIVAGGAGGALVANDQRTAGALLEDEVIEIKARAELRRQLGDAVNVEIVSYNRRPLLVGQAPTQELLDRAEAVVRGVENVRRDEVINRVEVGGPSSLTTRAADSILTAKVKGALCALRDKGFSCLTVKAVTEKGAVYLLGLVTREQAANAVEAARKVRGVLRVVKVFEYRD